MRRPAFHPHVQALVDGVDLPSITPELVENLRAQNAGDPDELTDEGLVRADHEIVGHDGAPIMLSSWRAPGTRGGPVFVFFHGGGLISGDRFACGDIVPMVQQHGGVVVGVDYRLAPEHPAPAPVEDCVAAVRWVLAHRDALGYEPGRVVLAGTSAGGGLVAGVLLALRDRGDDLASVLGGWLNCPMLDDSSSSVSAAQFEDVGTFWTAVSNRTAWDAVLPDRALARPYDAPARATDLSGLPPLLVTVGSAEPFRDEAVAFASSVWRDGGSCELHVAAGGAHCFDAALPDASITKAQAAAVATWFAALLHPDDPADAADDIAKAKELERHYR